MKVKNWAIAGANGAAVVCLVVGTTAVAGVLGRASRSTSAPAFGGQEAGGPSSRAIPTTEVSRVPLPTWPIEPEESEEPTVRLEQGTVPVPRNVEDRPNPPVVTERTVDGAVLSFSQDVQWVLASELGEVDRGQAARKVSNVLNSGDLAILSHPVEPSDIEIDFSSAAYRVASVSGETSRPEQVMVEFLSRMRVDDETRWLVLGGITAYREGEWQLGSLRPIELKQPKDLSLSLTELSEDERTALLGSPGWMSYRE